MTRWLLAIVVLAAVFGGIFGGRAWLHQRAASAGAQSYPAAMVATATARQARWDNTQRVIGTLRAVAGTDVAAQVAGNVTEIGFESGARVARGALLVQLDDATQRAALQADEARREQAQVDRERARRLYRRRAISQQELQDAELALKLASAAVESDRAVLAKLRITAPFDGVLGIRQVSLGQYLAPGTAIVDLQRWDPMLLDFALPQELLGGLQTGQAVSFSTDAHPDHAFTGTITAVGARVDADTRNIHVQATLPNADELLRPGLFGHASLALGDALAGVELPRTAVAYSTFGDTVYVVSDGAQGGLVAHARVVNILAERDDRVLLQGDALQDGDQVVVAGQNKLQDGAPVQVQEEGAGQEAAGNGEP